MDWVRRAIETGELTPVRIALLREIVRAALREEGVPVRSDGDGSRERREGR